MSRQEGARESSGAKTDKLTVYYDGACPLCRREIDFYRRRRGADAIEWIDAAAVDTQAIAPDLTRAKALARFHVRLPDGTLESGARGFGALWSALPGFGLLAKLARSELAQPMLEAVYRGFLKLRPMAQRLVVNTRPSMPRTYPLWLERELRSSHAGETGAVAIYRGILAVGRGAELRRFANRHLQAEARHLFILQGLLPSGERSRLLPVWTAAGFLTGALPSLFGRRAVYATIDAVETFVDRHYRQQMQGLAGEERWGQVRSALRDCHRDEVAHRDEARQRSGPPYGFALRCWLRAVAVGSTVGVAVARRI